ncbi:MAG: hypothetical protein NT157_00610 [Candidatus Micrarchaeota archaeon]|nr:hypothetical protein [Candidatus Micrarchaeota archaeon]
MQMFEKDIGEYWRVSKLHFAAYVAGIFLFAFLAPYFGEELAYVLLGFFQLAIVLHLGWKSNGLGMRLPQSVQRLTAAHPRPKSAKTSPARREGEWENKKI